MLKVKDLVKYYYDGDKKLEVLRGVNLEVKNAEILGICGQSGAGKSTLLHLMGGLDRPNSGEIFFNDREINSFSEINRAKWRNEHIGFIFQFYNLLPEFNVLENIFLPALISGKSKGAELREKAFQLLKTVHMEQRADSKSNELSGGEQQRIAIARALMNDPDMILADEPTGNLDKENSESIFNLIMELNEAKKKTFVIVTHNEALTKRFNRVVHLVDGLTNE